jgi:hypothetical protein
MALEHKSVDQFVHVLLVMDLVCYPTHVHSVVLALRIHQQVKFVRAQIHLHLGIHLLIHVHAKLALHLVAHLLLFVKLVLQLAH